MSVRALTIAGTFLLLCGALAWPAAPWAGGEPADTWPDTPRGRLERGGEIFEETCVKCHGDETSDAPFIGDVRSWKPLIHKGIQTLVRHALEGHGGPEGMPPKGGFDELGNEDVAAAVTYMVHESQQLEPETLALVSACGPPERDQACTPELAKKYLILYLLRSIAEKSH